MAPKKTAKPPASKPAVYGYVRVSHKKQKQKRTSLDAQRKAIGDYYRGLLKRETRWGGVFEDAAVSASKHRFGDREAGSRLNAALKKGDHVVIAKLDRGFRDTRDAANQLDRWRTQGVIAHLLDIRVDTSTSVGRLVIDIMAAIAAWEGRRIGERIREAFAYLRGEGLAPNGAAVFGTRLQRRRKGCPKRVGDPAERKWMRRVIALRKQGLLWREIAAKLAKEGAKTRDGRRWSKQRCWRAAQAEAALRRPKEAPKK